jgi:HEAT repeat protein
LNPQLGIFTTDVNLVIRTWDEWLERATARSASEVCGRVLSDVFPEIEQRGFLVSFHRAIEHGVVEVLSPALHGYLIFCPLEQPAGQFDRMQQRVLIAPLRQGNRITGLMVTIEDVTVRREYEIKLAAELGHQNWQVRRDAVQTLVREQDVIPVSDLINKLRMEHRDPGLLNSILPVLVSSIREGFDALVELTHDEDPELRMYAALALGEGKDRRAIPALMTLLHDTDANVKYHAIDALSKLKAAEAVEELAGIAESREFFLAFPALDALAAIGEPLVARRIVPLLEDESLRSAAVSALGSIGDESMVAPMAQLLEYPNLVPVVVQALADLYQRYQDLFGEGEHIGDLFSRHASEAGARNMMEALNRATGETLRAMVRVIGWLDSESVIAALAHLLASPDVQTEVIEALVRHGKRVVEPLCDQLESEDPRIRRSAVAALGRIGDKRSVPALIAALKDPELTVAAAEALAKIGDPRAYEPMLMLLSHDRGAVRQAAIGTLNSLGHPKTSVDVKRLLVDSNARIRESAVRIAGYFGYHDTAGLLVDRLNDADSNVRRAAVENLPYIQDERALPLLLEATRDPSPKIRSASAQSLAFMEPGAAVGELLRMLNDADPWVRYHAARSLGRLESLEALDDLAALAQDDPATQVRIAAVDALGSIGGRRAVAILAPIVESDDTDLARAALMALGAVGHPDALQPILTILRSEDPLRRREAVHAVGLRRDRDAINALQWTAATDTDSSVSKAAVGELARIAMPESIAALIRLTADRRVREQAIGALSRLGAVQIEAVATGLDNIQMEVRRATVDALSRMKHPAASEVLSRALDDERPEVRLTAVLALRRLGSSTLRRKLSQLAHRDPDPGVQKAAEEAIES